MHVLLSKCNACMSTSTPVCREGNDTCEYMFSSIKEFRLHQAGLMNLVSWLWVYYVVNCFAECMLYASEGSLGADFK